LDGYDPITVPLMKVKRGVSVIPEMIEEGERK
jgi:hypothetical protein